MKVEWVVEDLGGATFLPVAYNADQTRWVIDGREDGNGVGFYDSTVKFGEWEPVRQDYDIPEDADIDGEVATFLFVGA